MSLVLALGAAAMPVAAGARAAATAGTWRTAKEVPGLGRLNAGGNAQLLAVSCASAGNCSAGGYYSPKPNHLEAFVVDEVNGTWRTAEAIPGTPALNQVPGQAGVASVSCASAGNCGADGYYTGKSGHGQAFVVSEAYGRWGTAREVPGTAALNAGGMASVQTVSCASAGKCGAGGGYTGKSGQGQAFVVSEVNGVWGTAEEVAAALNKSGLAWVSSVSCASAGHCSAGGVYSAGKFRNAQAFVVNEKL